MIEDEKLRAAFDTFEARSVAQLVALHAIFEEFSATAQDRVITALRTAKESASKNTSPSRIKRLPLALEELEDLLTGDQ